jgi:hypothetical protein
MSVRTHKHPVWLTNHAPLSLTAGTCILMLPDLGVFLITFGIFGTCFAMVFHLAFGYRVQVCTCNSATPCQVCIQIIPLTRAVCALHSVFCLVCIRLPRTGVRLHFSYRVHWDPTIQLHGVVHDDDGVEFSYHVLFPGVISWCYFLAFAYHIQVHLHFSYTVMILQFSYTAHGDGVEFSYHVDANIPRHTFSSC